MIKWLRALTHGEDPIPRDQEVLELKHQAAVAIQTHHRLYREIAAYQRELERRGRGTKGI